jgi:dTDP-4-dehydrorhamnose 3,5-epimerase
MKLIEGKNLELSGVSTFKFSRFRDNRGYFTETYRRSDLGEVIGKEIVQINESYSRAYVIRGLHFQWNPYMDKLVRVISGRMIDLFLDIRLGSPTFGKIGAYPLSATPSEDYNEWIWVPAGFAHGCLFLSETILEYLCTGEYCSNCEAGISPLAEDIDWSLCDSESRNLFMSALRINAILSEKDRNGLTLEQWQNKEESKNFIKL